VITVSQQGIVIGWVGANNSSPEEISTLWNVTEGLRLAGSCDHSNAFMGFIQGMQFLLTGFSRRTTL